jgi:hypothetical protein
MPWVHPFTSVIAGPKGSEKSMFVRRFVHNIKHMISGGGVYPSVSGGGAYPSVSGFYVI